MRTYPRLRLSQSREGPLLVRLRMISTTSPFLMLAVERDHAAVDLRADGLVAEVGVDAVGEVERRRARGQVEHVALGRIDEDLVVEDVGLDALHELVGAGEVALPVEELAQPGDALLVLAAVAASLCSASERRRRTRRRGACRACGSGFRAARPPTRHDGGVQRLVHAVFRVGDVVVELARDGAPERVDDAERVVAVGHGVDEDAEGKEVVDLVERLRLLASSAPSSGGCCRCAWRGP